MQHSYSKTIAHYFYPVKSRKIPAGQIPLPLLNDTPYIVPIHKHIYSRVKSGSVIYGVSLRKTRPAITPGLLAKKWDLVRKCLVGPVGLTKCQVNVVQRLLQYYTYCGAVYPKASQVAPSAADTTAPSQLFYAGLAAPRRHYWGCSRASFWRTIGALERRGLVQVINRYLRRPQAQISNEYRLDGLLVLIARYLAEHGTLLAGLIVGGCQQFTGSAFWDAWRRGFLFIGEERQTVISYG